MKFKIRAIISLNTSLEPANLAKILKPENETPDGTIITTHIQDDIVITDITGTLSVRSLLRGIDDILSTTSLALNVAESTD